ncbi:MAG: anaerobic ribonucleoside-triphosphate reductase activating protein, partial [Clostridia bacterium]|nr:anaerobic ribonucleoside-triphosphate reductase activating protein [Clostridia bacterium]
MKIGGFLKQSFVDFPRTLSAVIFTCGCNFNCWYCHNADLIKCT